jgi:O-antigen/teichoic acid export membrane protein
VRKRFRRTRAIAMVIWINLVLNVVFNVVGLVSTNTLGNYTATGSAVLLAIFMLFAAWAWWYGEDRDRRAELRDAQRRPPGDSG